MKKSLTCLALMLLFPALLFCQDQKTFMLGGHVAVDYRYITKIDDHKTVNFEILPRFGYVANPNVIIGLETGFTYIEDWDNDFDFDYPYRLYTLRAFIRYFKPMAGNFHYIVEVKGGTRLEVKSDYHYYDVSLDVGLMYFIKSNMSIEFKLLSLANETITRNGSESKMNHLKLEYELITPNIGFICYF